MTTEPVTAETPQGAGIPAEVPRPLEEARRRFEQWRKTRPRIGSPGGFDVEIEDTRQAYKPMTKKGPKIVSCAQRKWSHSERLRATVGSARGCLLATISCVVLMTLIPSCSVGPEPLMETPVLYRGGVLDPFAHLAEAEKSPSLSVFYATKREPDDQNDRPRYGTRPSERLHLGTATVHFGDENTTWDELRAASLTERRPKPMLLQLDKVTEMASLDRSSQASSSESLSAGQKAFVDLLNSRLKQATDPEVVVYVHGAKVGFYRCCVRTAEFNHFAGRDFVSVVFDWPSHPNILSYVWGSDPKRAEDAADDLRALIDFLASNTEAKRIHILCYSAGAVVAFRALTDLRRSHAGSSASTLRERFRIGVVVFAASDLPLDVFLSEVEDIHDVAERISVTVSDADEVLDMAVTWMGGGKRMGSRSEEIPEDERAHHDSSGIT